MITLLIYRHVKTFLSVITLTLLEQESLRYMTCSQGKTCYVVIVGASILRTIMHWKMYRPYTMILKMTIFTQVRITMRLISVGTRAGLLHIWRMK